MEVDVLFLSLRQKLGHASLAQVGSVQDARCRGEPPLLVASVVFSLEHIPGLMHVQKAPQQKEFFRCG